VRFEAPGDASDDLAALLFEFDALGTEIHSAGLPLPRLPDAAGNPPAEVNTTTQDGFDWVIATFGPSRQEKDLRDCVGQTFGLLGMAPPPLIETVYREDATWKESWKAFFKPLQLSESLWVCPTWETFDAPTGAQVLLLDPGFAFGTGQHPTTALCVEALESIIRLQPRGGSILDVGCGSGILSLAAVKLGASRAVAIDIDPSSIRATRENAEINAMASSIELPGVSVDQIHEQFPLVVANILAVILIGLAEPMISRVASGGTLLLSGILKTQELEVHQAYGRAAQASGLSPLELPTVTQQGDWITMTYLLGTS